MRQYIVDMRPGWTLEYVDSLGMNDVQDLLYYAEGKHKARA